MAEQLQILLGIAGRGGSRFRLIEQLLSIAHDEADRLAKPFLPHRAEVPPGSGARAGNGHG